MKRAQYLLERTMKGHAAIPGPRMIKFPLQSFNEYLKMISFMPMPTTFSSFIIRDIEIVSLLLSNSNIILAVLSNHPLSLMPHACAIKAMYIYYSHRDKPYIFF